MPPTDQTTRILESRRLRGLQVALLMTVVVVTMRLLPETRDFLGIFPLIENSAYDTMVGMAPPDPPGDIAIVAIDDKSLQVLGRFQSWHRDIYAALLDRLKEARVVGFDVLFPEPDEDLNWVRSSPLSKLRPNEPFDLRTADEVFADAIARHGRVVLATHWGEASEQTAEGARIAGRLGFEVAQGNLPRADQGLVIVPPTARLATAARATGYTNLYPDRDGVFRRFRPFMAGAGRRVYTSFPTAIALAAAGEEGAGVFGTAAPRGRLQLASRKSPGPLLDREGNGLINYCGPSGTIPTYSLVDVLRDPEVTAKLRDRIVLVGATAPGLYDVRSAPYTHNHRVFYGVESNANIVSTIMSRRALRDSSASLAWGGLAILLGMGVAAAVWFTGEVAATVLSVLILFGVAAPSCLVAFMCFGTWIPYGAILLCAALPLAVGLPERLTIERRLVERQFGVYVSPDVLRELLRSPDAIKRSQRRTLTVMFCDVRGSTTLSERLAPEVWTAQLNEYLTQMSRAIFAYDGYLDKFMGDGIMAVWNAFGTQEDDHAELAVRAGLQMLRRLDALNARWEGQPDRTPFKIGIGIHTGEAITGSVGSEERVQYTAIGDTVNAASRIEGLTKEYGVPLVVTAETAARLPASLARRDLGETAIRGREGTLQVFEVVAQPPTGISGEE